MANGHVRQAVSRVTGFLAVLAGVTLLTATPAKSDDLDLGSCAQATGTYAGTLDATDPTFGRFLGSATYPPFGSGTPGCSGSNDYEYDSYTFRLDEARPFHVRTETVQGGDTFLGVYYSPADSTPFPGANTTGAAACVNLAASNDDGGAGLLSEIELGNARQGWYTVVVTSFSSSPSGTYTLEIDCAVATLGTPVVSAQGLIIAMLLLLAVGAFGVCRLRRT